ncbi:MAG: PAS domain-containing sensor histidine kinase [Actinobacteria bacterium]|nr:MAG: PAS domain-containing sensor histidine kinase [Actinomycetota bacterium]
MTGSIIVALDVISLISFSAALLLILRARFEEFEPYARVIRVFLVLAISVYAFVAFSNILEHAGITAQLDEYEDYVEILFVPLIAYALYSMQTARRFKETQRAEQLLRAEHGLLTAIVDTSPTGIMLVTSSGSIAFANDTARDTLSLQTIAETGSLAMPPDLTCISSESTSARPLALDELALGQSFRGSVCIVEAAGRKMALSVSASPLGDSAEPGAARGSVVAFVDVTEREQARQMLLDAQARYSLDLERTVDERTVELLAVNRALEAANRAKRDFLASASHEFKTPLNAIQGFTGLMLDEVPGPVNAEQMKQLGLIRDSSTELLKLVERLLELEKIESGHAVVTWAPTVVSEVVQHVVDLVAPLANERGVTLVIDSEDAITAETDAGLLGQIVRNLVSNAVKFTPSGGTVTLRVSAVGESARVAVVDTGVGIAPEDQARIFEPFAQVDNQLPEKPPGTGLGLAICRELTTALDGTITVSSAPGEGSTFVVEIPLSRAAG